MWSSFPVLSHHAGTLKARALAGRVQDHSFMRRCHYVATRRRE
jgi:hypothetical protein